MAKRTRYDAIHDIAERCMAERRDGMTFLEVGTYNGKRAAKLCQFWIEQTGTSFTYVGFDLFEDMDLATNTQELSKSTLPPSKAVVEKTLQDAGAKTILIKGNTRDTLPLFVGFQKEIINFDFIYIDGGHSLQTVRSDWETLRPLVTRKTFVLFDDYYENRADFGCKPLIVSLQSDPKLKVELLDPVDVMDNGLQIRMVLVRMAE